MLKQTDFAILAASLLVVGLTITFASAKPSQGSLGKTALQVPIAVHEVWDASKVYTVEPVAVRGKIQPRTPEQERRFRDASAILSRLKPVPAERIQFYSWFNREDCPVQFAGWGCLVHDVTPTPEGWLITLWVNPFAFRAGSMATVHGFYVEEYLWSENGGLRFMRGYPHPDYGPEPGFSSF